MGWTQQQCAAGRDGGAEKAAGGAQTAGGAQRTAEVVGG